MTVFIVFQKAFDGEPAFIAACASEEKANDYIEQHSVFGYTYYVDERELE